MAPPFAQNCPVRCIYTNKIRENSALSSVYHLLHFLFASCHPFDFRLKDIAVLLNRINIISDKASTKKLPTCLPTAITHFAGWRHIIVDGVFR
jgi:hypothetical protein